MRIKQVSVFVENKPGRLSEMLEALRQKGINIRALCVADSSDFGVVRMVLSDAEEGADAIRQAGFTVKTTEIIGIEVPDVPGGLLKSVVEPLAQAGINLEYAYGFIDPTPGKALVAIRVDDIDRAEQALGQ